MKNLIHIMNGEVTMTEEKIQRYLELKQQEKEIAKEIESIKEEIFLVGYDEFEVGSHLVKVSQRTRFDLNKDNVAKLIEDAVDAGLIAKESVAENYIKETSYKVVTVK